MTSGSDASSEEASSENASSETQASKSEEDSSEEKYDQAMAYIEQGEYREALRILSNAVYHIDTEELEHYCAGMHHYNNKAYGQAIKRFRQAGDTLDAKAKLQEVLGKVEKYNGTYYADDLTYPGMGIGNYMFVNDGKVTLESESMYKKGEAVYYFDYLMEKDNIGLMIGSMLDAYTPFDPTEDDYEYTFIEDNGEILVIAYETNDLRIYNGLYSKISDSFPPEK